MKRPPKPAQHRRAMTRCWIATIWLDAANASTAPDNSGYALLGAALGTVGKLAASDRRLNDGSNVYSFVYKGDPNQRQYIGLMAQEVRKRTPSAVHKLPSGYLAVDYGLALERAIGAGR
jgi:hypothetical protein